MARAKARGRGQRQKAGAGDGARVRPEIGARAGSRGYRQGPLAGARECVSHTGPEAMVKIRGRGKSQLQEPRAGALAGGICRGQGSEAVARGRCQGQMPGKGQVPGAGARAGPEGRGLQGLWEG